MNSKKYGGSVGPAQEKAILQKMQVYKSIVSEEKKKYEMQQLDNIATHYLNTEGESSPILLRKAHTMQHNQLRPLSKRDIKQALSEEWIEFFKSRLAEIGRSELEHNNAQIISFNWPREILALIDDSRDTFTSSLNNLAQLRNEVMDLLYTHAQNVSTRKRIQASVDLSKRKQRKKVG